MNPLRKFWIALVLWWTDTPESYSVKQAQKAWTGLEKFHRTQGPKPAAQVKPVLRWKKEQGA